MNNQAVIISKVRLETLRRALNTAIQNAACGRLDLAMRGVHQVRDLIGREIDGDEQARAS